MQAGRKNFPSVFDDIRRLLQIIPMRHEAALRAAIALRVEIDETTEEVLGDNARDRLQRVSNVHRTNTFDAAISAIEEMGILRVRRRYSNGSGGRVYQRGAAYVMTRENWPTPESAPRPEDPPSPILNDVTPAQRGGRNFSPPLNGEEDAALNGGDGTALSGGDLHKDNDEAYDEGTASTPSLAGANSSNEKWAGQTNSADTPPITPQAVICSTTSIVIDAVTTIDSATRSEIEKPNQRAKRVRQDHRYGLLPMLDGSEGVKFDLDTSELTLTNGTKAHFEKLAAERGLDLNAACTRVAKKLAGEPRKATPLKALAEINDALHWQAKDKRSGGRRGWKSACASTSKRAHAGF